MRLHTQGKRAHLLRGTWEGVVHRRRHALYIYRICAQKMAARAWASYDVTAEKKKKKWPKENEKETKSIRILPEKRRSHLSSKSRLARLARAREKSIGARENGAAAARAALAGPAPILYEDRRREPRGQRIGLGLLLSKARKRPSPAMSLKR